MSRNEGHIIVSLSVIMTAKYNDHMGKIHYVLMEVWHVDWAFRCTLIESWAYSGDRHAKESAVGIFATLT